MAKRPPKVSNRVARGVALPIAVAVCSSMLGSVATARPKPAKLADVAKAVAEQQQVVTHARKATRVPKKPTEERLAKRLVEGQLKLEERDVENAAIVFLDLIENHPDSQAAPQAVYFLGESLMLMDMNQWAAEMFSRNLRTSSVEARRFHQRSVARLFDLAIPRRKPGFARRPGFSATPEARARLRAIGVAVDTSPPSGNVAASDISRLVQWAQSYPASEREPELRYAFGRFLYLTGQNQKAQAELDALGRVDEPIENNASDLKWRLRAGYIAAAATLADNDRELALERFSTIAAVRAQRPEDRQIVDLARMAIGRIHHDEQQWDQAVAAYRRIGRDSPMFSEALYETSWTLLRAGHHDRAIQALDILLIYDPDSPLVPEIKQLRGKIKIQQRNYQAAEKEFMTLRREFDRLAKGLGRTLEQRGDASRYFAAVVGEDMEHFSLAALLPVAALPVARALPRALQARDIARLTGEVERELVETRALLTRMEEAVGAKQRARLFTDLAAHLAALNTAEMELTDAREQLVRRVVGRRPTRSLQTLERQRVRLRQRVDNPLGPRDASRASTLDRIQTLGEKVHKIELIVSALRAQLVATERYFEDTRNRQKINHQAFLTQAADLRDEMAALEQEGQRLRRQIARAESSLRFRDPWVLARRAALAKYRQHLEKMFASGSVAVATAKRRPFGSGSRPSSARPNKPASTLMKVPGNACAKRSWCWKRSVRTLIATARTCGSPTTKPRAWLAR